MVRREVIRRRLQKLDTCLEYLTRAQKYSFEEFSGDVEVNSAVERNLQVAIEALNDMAGHVVVNDDLGTFERSRDLPLLFEKHGLIEEE